MTYKAGAIELYKDLLKNNFLKKLIKFQIPLCLSYNQVSVEAKLFSVVPSNRTTGNGHKWKHRKLFLNIRKTFML